MPSLTIALCLEYPLALRGGVSVLVEELIHGLASDFRLVLVSPDEVAPASVLPLLAAHIHCSPEEMTRAASQALAGKLRALGVALAHFHIGGTYGWGIRVPGQSPITATAGNGIAVCTTVHLTVSPLDGYCGPEKALWFKLALLPVAWLGKLHALAHTRFEIAVSRHDEARLRRWYWPRASRFRQIYHSRLHLAPEPPAVERAPTILNIGHIARRKGQHVLAQAFAQIAARHPAWQLQLAGPLDDTASVAQVRALIERAGLQARIHLSGSRDDTESLMRTAGIYVQPSIHEALGLALQEALFYGCPSIGTLAGGIPELITNGDNGLLVPQDDVAALAAALDRLISDPALRGQLGQRARPSIISRGMTADTMLQRHRELYRELLP